MANTPLASLSLTHVHYNPGDPLSYISAWLALVPQGLCVVYVTLFITSREIEIALAFGGQLACEVLNFALKRLIKERRPEKIHVTGKGYGMPSSHAQFMAFWSVYVSLWLWVRFSPRRRVVEAEEVHSPSSPAAAIDDAKEAEWDASMVGATKGKHKKSKSDGSINLPVQTVEHLELESNGNGFASALTDRKTGAPVSPAYALQLKHPHLTKLVLSATLISIAGAVGFSRTYLEYHTPRQVYVGAMVGTIFAVVFFITTEIARRLGYVDHALELPLVRSLRVRDLACEEDLIELGWLVWERKRKLRKQKRRKSVRFAGLPEDVKSLEKPKKEKSSDDKKKRKKA